MIDVFLVLDSGGAAGYGAYHAVEELMRSGVAQLHDPEQGQDMTQHPY